MKKCLVAYIALCSTVACAKQIGLAGTTPACFKGRHSHHTQAPVATTSAQPTPSAQPANVDTTTAEDKKTTQVAVTGLLTIAADVANIVQNPHNPQAVIQNAQGILNSILNIVAAAIHRSGAQIDQATYIALLSLIDKELHDLVTTQKRALGIDK